MLTAGVVHMHDKGLIFRDLHPTRVHLERGTVKWNLVGMPYNYRKLLRSKAYTGHLNFTAPELILDESEEALTAKIDIWALGCNFFYLALKLDPFMFDKPKTEAAKAKQNILTGIIENPDGPQKL